MYFALDLICCRNKIWFSILHLSFEQFVGKFNQVLLVLKVQIFWEGNNFLKDLPIIFYLHFLVAPDLLQILWPSQNIWTLIQKWLTYLQVVIFDQGLFWADGAHLLKKFVIFPRIFESIMFCWILEYKFCIITKDRTWPRPFRGWRKKTWHSFIKNWIIL